jgi:hypothetical protein
MTGKDAIRTALMGTQQVLSWYISDLSDADLLVRPAPNANHIAWQLGHLINSEKGLVGKNVPGATYPELPAGFADQHSKPTVGAIFLLESNHTLMHAGQFTVVRRKLGKPVLF